VGQKIRSPKSVLEHPDNWRRKADGCLEWLGPRNPGGYGTFSLAGKTYLVHREVYRLSRGGIPAGMIICHRCDFPPCGEPTHLFAGTHLDNARDSIRKGRSPRMRVVAITDAGILDIKVRVIKGEMLEDLAKEYGVRVDRILKIIEGKERGWKTRGKGRKP